LHVSVSRILFHFLIIHYLTHLYFINLTQIKNVIYKRDMKAGPAEVADATMITGTIDEPPLVLRDGAVIVVRSTSSNTAASPPRTCATIQGDPSSSRAILPAAGAGATAVRAKNVLFRKGSTADNL
jgi:hypothetical protein